MDDAIRTRNYGIDVFRIVSMLFIICVHLVSYGFGPSSGGVELSNTLQGNIMNTFVICGVNSFGLISGFVGIRNTPKYSNIVLLWLQALIYSALFFCIYAFLGLHTLNAAEVIKSLTPVLHNKWWYLSKYVILFLMMPILNKGLRQISKRELEIVLLGVYVLYFSSEFIFRTNTFESNGGYSVAWLVFLYMLGAYLSLYWEKRRKGAKQIVIYLTLCTLTMLMKYLIVFLGGIINKNISGGIVFSYVSPLIVFESVALLSFFSTLSIRCERLIQIIRIMSSTSFGVFLIHTHKAFLQMFTKPLIFLNDFKEWYTLPLILLTSIVVYVVCSAIELCRIKLFSILKLKEKLLIIEDVLYVQACNERKHD